MTLGPEPSRFARKGSESKVHPERKLSFLNQAGLEYTNWTLIHCFCKSCDFIGIDDLSEVVKVAGEREIWMIHNWGLFEDSLIVSNSLHRSLLAGEITIIDPTSEHHLPEILVSWSH